MYMELGGLIKTMLVLMLMAAAVVMFISGQTCGCDDSFLEEETNTTQEVPKRQPHPDDADMKSFVDLFLD